MGKTAKRTVNLQKHMRIVIYLQPPFIMIRPKNGSNQGGIEYYGYCIDLLNMIHDKMANKSDTRDGEVCSPRLFRRDHAISFDHPN